jgi:hypothetical protein
MIAEAYAAAMQTEDGGFNADSLETDREGYVFELPTHGLSNGAMIVTGAALDAASFLNAVGDKYNNFRTYGQVNVYMKDSQMYFEVTTNIYKVPQIGSCQATLR